ncbi:MMPL family transporter [Nocardioides bigeumensis]|uniref:MMPL family transporter n=1 Tax=Nocardioides bigeumensis TaxID=433657 RepID=A0ABN2Y342_9ACTN
MNRWGAFVARRARAVLAAALVLVALAAVYGFGVFGALSDGGFEDRDAESSRALSAVLESFPESSADLVVVYSSDDLTIADPEFAAAVRDTLDGLAAGPVVNTVTWFDTQSPDLVSADQHATRVIVTLAGDDLEEKVASYDAVRDDLDASSSTGLETHVAGQYVVFEDVNGQVSKDIARAESISLPIVLLLSLVIFGSAIASLMPTMVGLVAVVGAFAVVRLITNLTDVSVFSINVITLLGMGLAIDYALFVVNRFREELGKRPTSDRADVVIAIERTMASAGRTVLFSGVIVAAALSSLLVFKQPFLRSMGYGGMAAVLVAMAASLTILPAVLTLLGRRLEWGTMPWRRRRLARAGAEGTDLDDGHGAWARIARSVMARPVAYLVGITATLLLIGSPILGAQWGSVDERILPEGSPSRVASEVIADEFGGDTSSAEVVVTGGSATEVDQYAADVAEVADVIGVQPVGSDGDRTLLRVSWIGAGQSQTSQDLVKDLREVPAPDGATVLVGGPSAATVDLVDSVFDRLPVMALMVGVIMLVLLFLAFGSVVLPLKAIVMAIISIAASFGVVTWIFQDGHLSGLLGFDSPGYLDVTEPILMLAILFGLSMDYEVFLLSRVREEWDRTGDNTAAVAIGMQRTGRIITSAALLLAVVIGGFATSGIVFIKMIGVGMLVAVLLDATVVRALLVPATMRLLGRANWWAPAPLARWWDRHGHHETLADEPVDNSRERLPVG